MDYHLALLSVGLSTIGGLIAAMLFFVALFLFGERKIFWRRIVGIFLISHLSLGIVQGAVSVFYPDASYSFFFSAAAFFVAAVWSKKILTISTWKLVSVSILTIILQVGLMTLARATLYEPTIISTAALEPDVRKGSYVVFQKVFVDPAPEEVVLYTEQVVEGSPWRVGRVISEGPVDVDGNRIFEIRRGSDIENQEMQHIPTKNIVGELFIAL